MRLNESPWDSQPWPGAAEAATMPAAPLAPWGWDVSLMSFKVSQIAVVVIWLICFSCCVEYVCADECVCVCKWSKLGSNCRVDQLADHGCRVSSGAGLSSR